VKLDVEGIERATVEGVAPAKVIEIGGWLVPIDDGAIGRAKSAVPLSFKATPAALSDVEAAYWTEGLQPAFRLADAASLRPVRHALAARGYEGAKPTMVKIGDVARLATFRDKAGEILEAPDDAWAAVFTGEGFDPAESASRVAALRRSPDAVYGAVREDGRIVAVGVATFAHGWAGIHGMRTDQARRGRGHASEVLTALGRAIAARGVERAFLQVEEPNDARSLYRKAGFQQAWRYSYWTRRRA
jgi:ribosomal protein S18 acetylase RimI-like enzyme